MLKSYSSQEDCTSESSFLIESMCVLQYADGFF